MFNNRRSGIEIIGEILTLSCRGARRTEILYQGNLSYTQLQSYLPYLVEKDILQENTIRDNGYPYKLYRITDKGLVLLEDINRVMGQLD